MDFDVFITTLKVPSIDILVLFSPKNLYLWFSSFYFLYQNKSQIQSLSIFEVNN